MIFSEHTGVHFILMDVHWVVDIGVGIDVIDDALNILRPYLNFLMLVSACLCRYLTVRNTLKMRTTEPGVFFAAASALFLIGSQRRAALAIGHIVLDTLALLYILFSYDQAWIVHNVLKEFEPTCLGTKVGGPDPVFDVILECRYEILAFLVESLVHVIF